MVDKNITIPYSLFSRIIDLLEFWDVPEYTTHYREDYEAVLYALMKKKQSIELREAYARIVYAKDDDARHDERIRYLQQKRDAKGWF